MTQTIQRSPVGLLGLLDSKAGGLTPAQLGDVVYPMLDIAALYGWQSRVSINSTLAAGALVQGVNVFPANLASPAPGEIWLVRSISVFATANYAAATFRFAAGWVDNRNAGFQQVGALIGGAIGDRPVSGGQLEVVFRPGSDQVAVWVPAIAGAVDLQANVCLDRVPI